MELTISLVLLTIIAGLIKGFAGFGMSLILISVLMGVGVTPSNFMPILVPLFVILDIMLFLENKKYVKLDFGENFTLHPTTMMTLFLGTMLGTYILTKSEADFLKLIFAILVLIILFFFIYLFYFFNGNYNGKRREEN